MTYFHKCSFIVDFEFATWTVKRPTHYTSPCGHSASADPDASPNNPSIISYRRLQPVGSQIFSPLAQPAPQLEMPRKMQTPMPLTKLR